MLSYTLKELEVLEDMPVIVLIKDEEGKYLWGNKFWRKLAGIDSAEDVVGKTDYDMIWAEHAYELIRNDKQVLDSGEPVTTPEHVKLVGIGEVTGDICKFPATIDGKRCVMGIALLLDI